MSSHEVISQRVDAIRALLEACAREGHDPALVGFSQFRPSGVVDVYVRSGFLCTTEEAYGILARLAPGVEPQPLDVRPRDGGGGYTSYEAGGYLVYAELRPEARTEARTEAGGE